METHGREMDAPATENGSTAPPAANEDVPDPEEDDLDDLDGMNPCLSLHSLPTDCAARYAWRFLRIKTSCA